MRQVRAAMLPMLAQEDCRPELVLTETAVNDHRGVGWKRLEMCACSCIQLRHERVCKGSRFTLCCGGRRLLAGKRWQSCVGRPGNVVECSATPC